ncbi:MAG: hypothetical protein LC745_06370 [Planctomycetia bacterium]|nr:hypothetical protein [Planctomycetia bacterium]
MRIHPRRPSRRFCWSFTLLPWVGLLGCNPGVTDDERPDYTKLVPVTGTVTINGKGVPGVVVTFLPPMWSASNGETKDDGTYTLQTAGKPGALPGHYKVGISYLVSAEGEPQGLAPRSAMSLPPEMLTAREKLPPEYSDLGRTTQKATVSTAGGRFDFDVKAVLDAPPPAPRAGKEPSKDADAP